MTDRELIERLTKVAEQACKCLALEVILQGTVAEARAALAAPVVPDTQAQAYAVAQKDES